ncbi:MAG: hypothetical protein HYV60_05650 [Planctomycetia bacterium]|nr:hypothetical protein [Planctomycetia bacterium]
MTVAQEFGIVGLGRMGANLALQALENGLRVVGYRAKGAPEELVRAGLIEIREFMGFRDDLGRPRVVLVYVPAGPAIDSVLAELAPWLEPGDVVADGGNSYWRDSVKRHRKLLDKGIHFVDLGTADPAKALGGRRLRPRRPPWCRAFRQTRSERHRLWDFPSRGRGGRSAGAIRGRAGRGRHPGWLA